MGAASITTTIPVDSPQTRRYNRIRRWLGIADFALGAVLLVASKPPLPVRTYRLLP